MSRYSASGFPQKNACSLRIPNIASPWVASLDFCQACFDQEQKMHIRSCLLLLALSIFTAATLAQEASQPAGSEAESPAFHTVPELPAGFNLLYQQKFAEARTAFESWKSSNPHEPFGEVAIAATYLYEEMYRQGALTSDFFLNERKFLHGIDGKPDPERMAHFREALGRARH